MRVYNKDGPDKVLHASSQRSRIAAEQDKTLGGVFLDAVSTTYYMYIGNKTYALHFARSFSRAHWLLELASLAGAVRRRAALAINV